MKKIFTLTLAALFAVSAFALDVNIYASGLKSSATTAENKVEIEYILNAPATALEVQLFDEDGEVIASVPIVGDDYMTVGFHYATIDLAEVPGGSWNWGVKATGVSNPGPDDEEDDPILEQVNGKEAVSYIFYNPQGVVSDRSFESDWFGRLYVTESMDGDTDGMTDTSKGQKRGVFVYDQTYNPAYDQNNTGYLGGVDFHNGRQGIRRPAVDAEGNVFVCDNNVDAPANSTGIWMMNPADPSANFVEILDVTKRGVIYTKACGVAVEGVGAERVIYVLDNMKAIVRFPIGEATAPYSLAPDTVVPQSMFEAFNIVNSECTFKLDGKGGFWIFQNRGQLDMYPMCAHINKKGELDFQIAKGMNDEIAPSTGYRGSGAISFDGSMLAFGGAKSVNLYEIEWSGSKVSSLKRVIDYEFPNIGTNVDGIEFDVANNVFVVSASSEYMHIFALPKVDNTFITPAPKKYLIESKNETGVENIVSGKTFHKGVYDITGKYIGENTDNLPKGMYIVNGKKLVK